jgi:hypothetical protein
MPVVVAKRRPGSKPSLLSSMPAELFGKFMPNGRAQPSKPAAKPEVTKPPAKAKKSPFPAKRPSKKPAPKSDKSMLALPKENASQSGAYMAAVRKLACRRCTYQPPVGQPRNQFAHADQGKGKGIKTDVREGASLCGPHDGQPGCHWLVGTSGQIPKEERRLLEKSYAASTRAEINRLGLWPKKLPKWQAKGRK